MPTNKRRQYVWQTSLTNKQRRYVLLVHGHLSLKRKSAKQDNGSIGISVLSKLCIT